MTDMLAFAAANLDPADGPLHRAMAAAHTPRRDAVGGQRIGLRWAHPAAFRLGHGVAQRGDRRLAELHRARCGGAPAVVILSNSISRIEDIGLHLLDQRAELITEERQEIDLPADVLERYVGVYELAPEGTVTRTGSGLAAAATGLGAAPIYAATETEFFVKVIPVELTFPLDPRGAVTGLVLHFAGKQRRGKKIG